MSAKTSSLVQPKRMADTHGPTKATQKEKAITMMETIEKSGRRAGRSVRRVLCAGLVLISLLGAGAHLEAAEDSLSSVSVEVGLDAYSHYVWRGMLLTDDPVLQPSLTLGLAGFSFNVWGSIDTTDVNELTGGDMTGPTYNMQELDYTLSYGFSPMEGVDLEVGGILYTFPGTAFAETTEIYAALGVSVPYLDPSLTVYYDVDEAEGVYAGLSAGHAWQLMEPLSLSVGGSVGWGSSDYHAFYFGVDDSDLSDFNLSVGLEYVVSENVSVSATLAYSDFLGDDIGDAADAGYGEDGQFYGGFGFVISF